MNKRNKRTLQKEHAKDGRSPADGLKQLKMDRFLPQPEEDCSREEQPASGKTNDTNRQPADQEDREEDPGEGSNAVGFHYGQFFQGGKEKQRQAEAEESSQQSATLPRPFEKVTLPTDDSNTRRAYGKSAHEAIKEELGREEPKTISKCRRAPAKPKPSQQQKEHLPFFGLESMSLESKERPAQAVLPFPLAPIPVPATSYNPKIEEIQSSAPLRERFKELLPKKLQYDIGFQNRQLLSVLRGMDSAIQFTSLRSRSSKGVFFSDLASNLKVHHNGMEVTRAQLQQLLFLDPALYAVEQQFNNKLRRFDLQLKMAAVGSEDERVQGVYEKIVEYLLAKELEFLAERGERKAAQGWSEGFHPARYALPLRDLPPDPNGRNAEFQHMTSEQLAAVPNPHVRNFMQSARLGCEARSVTSEEVSSMIFSKVSVKAILSENFRQTEERNARLQEAAREAGVRPERAVLERVAEEVMMIYMAKNVANLFRKTLVDKLNQKLTTLKPDVLAQALEFVLLPEVGFLEERRTSSNDLVLQINRGKFEQIRQKIRELPK